MSLSHAQLALLADHSIDAVFWMDTAGQYLYVSPAFENLSGHAPAELIADPGLFERLIHPDDLAAYQAHQGNPQATGHEKLELRITPRNGDTRWIVHHCQPVFDAAGQLVGRVSNSRDITARKTSELQLRKAHAQARQFNNALDHVGAFVFIRDTRFRFAYANQLALEFFGCAMHRLIGAADAHFFPPETLRQLRALDQRVLAGEDADGEVVIDLPDGNKNTYWVVLSPIFQQGDAGSVTGITGIATDITRQKQLQENLTFLSRRNLLLAELATIAETLDEAALIKYGIKHAERLTRSTMSFFLLDPADEEAAPAWPADCQRQIRQSVSEQGKLVALAGVGNKAVDYTERDVETLELIASEIWRIIQRHRTEQELANNLFYQMELNQKLEEAQNQLLQSEKLASIGQLAAGVAHEINNPIGFISSNFGTLENYLRDLFAIADAYAEAEAETSATPCPQLDRVRALKREKDYDYLRGDIFQLMTESKDGLERVARIVRDLKDFSRVGEVCWETADLHAGIDSTLNIVANQIKYKCTVIKNYGTLPPVWCVSSQLNQVFMNLLVNAGHAIDNKGEITVTTGRQGEEIFVAISDTGCGIPPDNLKRIFDPFFTTKPVGSGTGLGLSLVYGIVQNHHGRIEVDSAIGKGTTFTVWLPVNPPGSPVAAPPDLTAA